MFYTILYYVDINGILSGFGEWMMVAHIWARILASLLAVVGRVPVAGTRVINYPSVGYPGSKNQYKSMP